MTPEERVAAIRERVEADSGPLKYQFYDMARDDITWLLDEHQRLTVALDAAQLALQADTHNFELARDAQAENERLRAVVELASAMPEPDIAEPFGPPLSTALRICVYCGGRGFRSPNPSAMIQHHAPDCPWQRLQAALRALDGGTE